VFCFKPHPDLLIVSIVVCGIALMTDIADGLLARYWKVHSVLGRQWDSLGDKPFYIAIIIAFLDNGFLSSIIAWGLITREISLYILRVLYIEKLPKLEEIRPYTNWHGYFMYGTIILGLSAMHGQIYSVAFEYDSLVNLSAGLSLLFGVLSIKKFMEL
ncbi:MAG: CDP-alcohol phosphatidyltransferase family protein, partial [Rhodospirillales bacterium]|nr:CDP-alcohol phosphatidyltransferase family protein [Rhodospirillales bacterium]